jgi:hypothetical protein
MSPRKPTKRLGELLVEQGLLSASQLEQALTHQRLTKEFLGVTLLRLKLVQPEPLLRALSEQFGMTYESLTPERVDWTLVDQFPASALSAETCFPIRGDAESVTVAIVNPLDAWALSAIEQAVKFRTIKPVLVLPEQFAQIQEAYRQRAMQKITQQLNDHGRHEIH